jgi:hypothetical protein
VSNCNYVAIVLIASTSDSLEYQTLYDETTLIIQANSVEEATAKAVQYGKSCEGSYTSADGFHIVKKFMHVEDVNDVLEETVGDVTAINARFFHDLDAYQKFREMLNSEE